MENPNSKFAAAVRSAMEQKNLQIRDIMEATEHSYEHTRRLVNGIAYPSKHIVYVIADLLGLDRANLLKLATEDRITRKYGKPSLVLVGRNPEVEPIEVAWPHLSENHKRDLISIAQMWSKQDHAQGTAASAHHRTRVAKGES